MLRKRNSFIVTEIVDKNNEKTIKNQIKTKGKKMKDKTPEDVTKNEDNSQTNHESMSDSNKLSVKKKSRNGMNRFREKCFQNRRQNGIILLSPKIEKKIYNLKKGLRNKGLDENEIKTIVRKRRRDEENKFNRNAKNKCFRCRLIGHKLADCPLNSNDCEEGVDVCYRCGSSEHKLSECSHKSNGLKFAKCFICSETGHLTKDCTENKRGVYPRGGECKACHSVNHLIKDCPLNQKDEELEKEITLSTFDANHSIDAEVNDTKPLIKTEKQKKVIKF